MLSFRSAITDDAEILSDLTFHSEKYLGYDTDYMNKFLVLYNLTSEFIINSPVYIMENENEMIDFWGLSIKKYDFELEYFYIAVKYIGQGYGRKLWNHLINKCKLLDILEFQFVTSPESVDFYKKMGAIIIDNVESIIKQDRLIPKLRYVVQ